MLDGFFELSDPERQMRIIQAGAVLALVLGFFMQRASLRVEPVRGGSLALLFHYLASSTISVVILVVIAGIVAELPILRIISSALVFSLSTWVFLMAYAAFESKVEVNAKPVIELD